MARPLEGLRVIDFGQYIAGPVTAMLLADHGADVVRVDPTRGPVWDTPANVVWNRGKRSIVLDLKQSPDVEVARRLMASADVLIENFRPGVMERLGLAPTEAIESNPRLVYCSLPGFASDDPRAGIPAWEGVIAAATDTYRPPRDAEGPPVYTAVPIASMFAAFTAAVSIVAALFSREQDGRGQHIEVPLFDAMFGAIGAHGLRVRGGAGGTRPSDFAAGVLPCADGAWVQFALAKPHFLAHFVRAAEIADRFDPEQLRSDAEVRAALFRALPEVIRQRTAEEWEQVGITEDVPLLRVRSAAEWMRTEHARTSGTFIEVDDPRYGRMLQPNTPLRLSASEPVDYRPAPAPDQDRDAVLAELDGGSSDVAASGAAATGDRRAALEGVRVVDLSLVLAGPYGGRTLAEFGADVVKVNPPVEEGAGIQFSRHRYHTDVNRGKRSILLDLRTPEGLDVLWRLLDRADVVIHNFRPGVLERLGIDYEAARARRPDIIYVGVGSYGSPGPWSGLPAYEPFGQAATGMSERQGGEGRPLMQPFAVNDYGTGLMSAFAALLALYHRARSGEGQVGEAALAYTGTFLQLPWLVDVEGQRWETQPRGPRALGAGPMYRLYRAEDGWFFLAARSDQLSAVAEVARLDLEGAPAGHDLVAALEDAFTRESVAHWCECLVEAGVGAHRLVSLDELMADPWVVDHRLSVTREHDTGEVITTTGPAPRFSRTPVVPGRPAPTPGSDADSILHEAGLLHPGASAEAV